MKLNYRTYGLMLLFVMFFTLTINAQERPKFLTVTTVHGNLDKDYSMDEWKAIEKTYFEKVTMKNEFILTTTVLVHYFTADNTEIKFVTGYSSWENIEKAGARTLELEKEAWPNEMDRKAFMKKQSDYYSPMHSDEIYSTVEGAKMPAAKSDKPQIYYIRVSNTAWPENGSNDEINALAKEFNENVTFKNKFVKAYYPSRHAWGSDSRDFVEAFVVDKLGDIEDAFAENTALIKAHWPDEAKRDAFFDKMGRYMSGAHGDYIFHNVPELSK